MTYQLNSDQHRGEAKGRWEEVDGLEHHGSDAAEHEEVVGDKVGPHTPGPARVAAPTVLTPV